MKTALKRLPEFAGLKGKCFTTFKSIFILKIVYLGNRYPGQIPPRKTKILPRTMENPPRLAEKEWKKITSKRKKIIDIENGNSVLPSIIIVSPID